MTPNLKVSDAFLHRVAREEGYKRFPYICPTGHWTIGYGHVIQPGEEFPNGLTEVEAWNLLVTDTERKAAQLWRLLERQPTQWEFEAMLSLVYNTGVGVQDGVKGDFADSTLLKHFNAGRITEAADEFLKWNKGRNPKTGKLEEILGLTNRRWRERLTFLGKVAV